MALAAGADYEPAIRLANVAGGLEVEKIGVATVTRDEILRDLLRIGAVGNQKILECEPLLLRDRQPPARWAAHRLHQRLLRRAARRPRAVPAGGPGPGRPARGRSEQRCQRARPEGSGPAGQPRRARALVLAGLEAVDYLTVFDESTPLAADPGAPARRAGQGGRLPQGAKSSAPISWSPTAAACTSRPSAKVTQQPDSCNNSAPPDKVRGSFRSFNPEPAATVQHADTVAVGSGLNKQSVTSTLHAMTKIAVYLPNWVGDAVMATRPCVRCRQHFVGARLIGVLRPYVAGVLEGTTWLDENICFETNGPWGRRWPAIAGRLRREQIDLAVLFPNSFRSAFVAWLGKCRRRVGYRRYGRDVLLTDRLTPVRGPDGRLLPSPIIDAYNRLAECAGCPWPGYRLELATTPRDDEAADAVWRHERLDRCSEVICLNPGQLSDRPSIGRPSISPCSRRKSRIAAEAAFWCSVGPVKRVWPASRPLPVGRRRVACWPAAVARTDQGVRPPLRPLDCDRQRTAAFRGRL